MSGLTSQQRQLVDRSTAPWLTLWLIADFASGKSYAVGGMGGGTYTFDDGGRGQYRTNGKGMSACRSEAEAPEVAVTWAEVSSWSRSLSSATRAQAAELQREGRALQAAYPPPYPGIGRPYCWDTPGGCTPEQRERDLADLASANEQRGRDIEAWRVRNDEHASRVQTFLASLADDDEPVDLLDLLAQMSAGESP